MFGNFIKANRKISELNILNASEILGISPLELNDMENNNKLPEVFGILLSLKTTYKLSNSEFEHMCNLIAEQKYDFPPDIIFKIFATWTQEKRSDYWQKIRREIMSIYNQEKDGGVDGV